LSGFAVGKIVAPLFSCPRLAGHIQTNVRFADMGLAVVLFGNIRMITRFLLCDHEQVATILMA
jgi:hypothetical protein